MKIGMIDKVFENKNYLSSLNIFCQDLQNNDTKYYGFVNLKEEYLEVNSEKINFCKEKELKIMHSEFWDEESSFHKLRHEFVYKN
jgi:putative two-component system hydrogenase maturation factor HypX/HoxX